VLLELSEILACPACGPPQVMVAVVHSAEGRRVTEGFLGCPACEARFAITDAVARLVVEGAPGRVEPSDSGSTLAPDTPVLLAALMGLEAGHGPVLLARGLAGAAAGLAGLAPSTEVIQLTGPGTANEEEGGEEGRGAGISRVAVTAGALPFQSGRLWGIGLAGPSDVDLLQEAARLLVPGGRVVVVRPSGEAPRAAEAAGLEVLAVDERALLATRPVRSP
jgi:uncharacterized protein YbaR (Trm112 family)